jgi:dolichol-phosphate mannosyltransferase
MIRFALDALTGFSSAPLKLASHAGLALSAGSVLIVLYILAGWLTGQTVPGWTSLMLVVVVLGAIQMFVLALMGEYIGRLYNEAKRRPLYIVQEVAGRAREPSARLGVIASGVSPAAVQGESNERRQDDVWDDRPPGRAA